jgi:hypothetical protein
MTTSCIAIIGQYNYCISGGFQEARNGVDMNFCPLNRWWEVDCSLLGTSLHSMIKEELSMEP